MTSWILESIGATSLDQARAEVARRLLYRAIGVQHGPSDNQSLQFVAEALELAAADAMDDEQQLATLRAVSAEAFQILRVLPRPADPVEATRLCLRTACLGVLAERSADAARMLREAPWPDLPLNSPSWGIRTHTTILDIWLCLIRKNGWDDLHNVQQRILDLREQQQDFEARYLEAQGTFARTAAWELVASYHLSKAAELLALFTSQGYVEGRFDIRQQLEAQFDRALVACERAELVELYSLTRLLARTAQQLVDNCIWTVTRAVNSRVTQFVQQLVSPERSRPIFEMLPPQRYVLREAGLLGSGHRAVVVNLPTSSGKTFIAQFRILQALNQFDHEQGWVAYLAPTRALVNQVCARLRRDFTPLGIHVERVSPALQVDGLEATLLTDKTAHNLFRVLVTTPEKLDLLLRGDWETKIGRPLTLVVVDEAHNLAQPERGIKLELLLATINRECRYAQFLLLTPFVPNAPEIARWLAPDSHNSIELALNWQPNDRVIVLSQARSTERRGDFRLTLETLHTSRQTVAVDEELTLAQGRLLGLTWSQIRDNKSKIAAATAQVLKERGPVIVLAGTIPNVWQLAQNFKDPSNRQQNLPEDIQFIQRYLEREFGADFALRELLEYGVGVHHSGLSDEAKALMEWLLERGQIQVLVATTTIAQGVNFPVSGVVLAAHQYPYGQTMPPEDFWNLAGRAGRVDQGSLGIVALAATDNQSTAELRQFINRQVLALNSTLMAMVQQAMQTGNLLELHQLFYQPAWSAFLQYLAHSYRQIDDAERFASEVEQLLRGTLGFQNLRRSSPSVARQLVDGVRNYGARIAGKPLRLVDSTGFSWESVSNVLVQLREERISEDVWAADRLFQGDVRNLQRLVGILFTVPELRDNLTEATGGWGPNSARIAALIRDWVNGASLPDLAQTYFGTRVDDQPVEAMEALTNCCRSIFGRLTQTAAWGLAALQAMTFGDRFDQLAETDQQTLRNLPARVFYGVNSDEAVALRLLGVPRGAAQPLARSLGSMVGTTPLPQLREFLTQTQVDLWSRAIGNAGSDYYHVWRVLEGLS